MAFTMLSVSEVAERIKAGKKVLLAGDEKLLRQLPAGHWIGGTIPYFMADQGGVMTDDAIYVTELPDFIKKITLRTYGEDSIHNIYKDAPQNGFSVIILPAASKIHFSFALKAPLYEEFATRPLIGWIAGVHLDNIGKVKPKVFYGETPKEYENSAVVLHAILPDNKFADVNIVNIFTQGDGDTIMFPDDGFSAGTAMVNGKEVNFAEYLKAGGIDTKLPLVANYSGAMINTSFQGVDEAAGVVNFYAPVFKGISYKIAAPVGDYVKNFTSSMPKHDAAKIAFSCNCILNYLYSELEGKKTGGVTGPITFGEIAYQLVNQTLAYLTINDL